jgi:hypothetical protein
VSKRVERVHKAENGLEADSRKDFEAIGKTKKGTRILLVDDNESIGGMLYDLLKERAVIVTDDKGVPMEARGSKQCT